MQMLVGVMCIQSEERRRMSDESVEAEAACLLQLELMTQADEDTRD
jgi:hypothetical protein